MRCDVKTEWVPKPGPPHANYLTLALGACVLAGAIACGGSDAAEVGSAQMRASPRIHRPFLWNDDTLAYVKFGESKCTAGSSPKPNDDGGSGSGSGGGSGSGSGGRSGEG